MIEITLKLRRNLIKYILFYLCAATFCLAQNEYQDLNFNSLSQDIGTRAITSIVTDYNGLIWIGTLGNGLISYNGYEIKKYEHIWNDNKSINNSSINSIYLDNNENLWIGTEEGLNLYNRDLDSFTKIPLDNLNSKIQVKAIVQSSDDELLVGTHRYGVYALNLNSFKSSQIRVNPVKNISNLQVNDITKNKRNAILFATNLGLLKYNSFNKEVDYVTFTTVKGPESVKNDIQTLLTNDDGSIWIGSVNEGLIKISTTPTNFYELIYYNITNKRILSLESNGQHHIICGTENDGLFILNDDKIIYSEKFDKSNPKGIKSNSIWSIFIDNENRTWLGYYNQGIDIYDNKEERFKSYVSVPNKTNSLFSNSVTAIEQDNTGRLWFGTTDGGIDVYNSKNNTYTNLLNQNNNIAQGLFSSDIVTLFIDSKENIWVGTWNSGLFFLKKNSNYFKNINISNSNGVLKSNRIMSFDEDSNGIIWIGSFLNGLYSYNRSINKFIHHEEKELKKNYIDTKNIRKVLVDINDNIWLGTRTGLYKISGISNNEPLVESYNTRINKIINNDSSFKVINTIFEDSKGFIWIGTEGYGLFKINPKNNTIFWINSNENFIQNSIASITETSDNIIWITGNKGISKLNPSKSNSITNYNTEDGLLANNYNKNAILWSQEGLLYFGCNKGVNYFHPDKIATDLTAPKVHFSNFKLFNKIVTPNEKNTPLSKVIDRTSNISLKYNQSFFTIDYFGLGYTRTQNIEYAYYLDGFETEWNYVNKSKSATYTNIPPGNYQFKVKAINSHGTWNVNPRILNIEILAPLWRTKTAYFLYVLFFLMITYIIYKFLNLRLKERLLIKQEREERKQIEGLNSKKIQFFTNISHEFRTPLTLILNPLEDIINNVDYNFTENIKEKHNIIHKNAKRLSRLIDELMDFRKLQFNKMNVNISKFDIVGFVIEVCSHFEEEAYQRNIILKIEHKIESLNIWADPSMVEKIIFNLLSNAFKATKKGGVVTVKIEDTKLPVHFDLIKEKPAKEGIKISIKDSGIGISKENINKIFTRFYQVNELDKQYYGGTGIGLEVVKSFIDLHKGKIEVKSEKNIGTKFTLFFPKGNSHFESQINNYDDLSDNNIYRQINTKISENEEKTKKVESNKKTILIVEDNLELRNYIKNELIDDYKIKTAENGQEGLTKALKFIPDLIISDLMMPVMDGFELCNRIKKDFSVSHIPLIMLTAKGMQVDKIKGIDLGADVYITKPFNMAILKSHIKQQIESREILFNKYFKSIDANQLKIATSLDKEFITNILNFIHENISDPNLGVEQLAQELLLSRSKLYRKIKVLTGQTASEFIRKIKLEKAKELLENTDLTISEISYKVGYSSPSYFTKCFKEEYSLIPKEIRYTLDN